MPNSSPIPLQAEWYVRDGRQRHGPYAPADLLARIEKGFIGHEAQFSRGDGWLTLTQFQAKFGGIRAEEDCVLLEPLTEEELQTAASPPPPPEQAEPATPEPVITSGAGAARPGRDRIVVIGRRSAGKTVYLAALYHTLWKSQTGLSMKALSGRAHTELARTYESLRCGEWPAATQRDTLHQMEFELEYRGRKRILVGLDYAGEVFRDAFVNDDVSSPQARALVEHIDRAMAVILLVDPAVAVRGDAEAQIDDDYGMVQAVQRIHDWPGGEDVPVVLLLTKADQNRPLFKNAEATREFIAGHYPALLRTLKNFKVFHASAVQTTRDAEGRMRPKPDSVQMNIVESLRYCLDMLEAEEDRKRIEQEHQAEQSAMQRMLDHQAESERQYNRRLAWIIGSIITIGICIMALILVFMT